MKRRTLIAAAALLATAGGVFLRTGDPNENDGEPKKGTVDFQEFSSTSQDPYEVWNEFVDLVVRESKNRVVLVDLFADWCPACHTLSPDLVPGAQLSGEDVLVLKVNVEDAHYKPTNLAVIHTLLAQTSAFPEIQTYIDGKLVGVESGALPPEAIADFIRETVQFRKDNAHLFEPPAIADPKQPVYRM